MNAPKVALVYDWLTNMGGAERVLLALHKAFPNAPIYTSVFDEHACPAFANINVRTTWLQHLPRKLRRKHQLFPLFRDHAFRRFNFNNYDVVLSVASAEAKAVRVPHGVKHICYCLTPTRYYWSHYNDYKKQPGFGWLNPLVRLVLPLFVGWMRKLDLRAAAGVTQFIGISSAVTARIKKYYDRDASIIYPPVDMRRFRPLNISGPRHGFVALGRQVAYKRIDLAVAACKQLNVPLTVFGNGPEHDKLKALAGPQTTFITGASDDQIAQALARAQGLFFPQEEDFGIVQVEALAAGCPVIAYAKGGALDVITNDTTGVFFANQTVDDVVAATKRLQQLRFAPKLLQQRAEQFSEEHFIEQITKAVVS